MSPIPDTLSSRGRAYQPHFSLVVMLVFVACMATPIDAQDVGTYRLSICVNPCSPKDSGVVRGYLVLFRDSLRVDTLPKPFRDSVERRSFWLLRRSVSANACFALPTGPTDVNGQELYVGIIRRGLTHWRKDNGTVRVLLYQSPDASYTIAGVFTADGLVGKGEQSNWNGGDGPTTHFRATRVKEADLSACL